jgi:oligopeptide/dipeptide ABC transporter ATP-binding protein
MTRTSPSQPNAAPLLEAHDLVKRFMVRQSLTRRIPITAVDGLSFAVTPGQTTALVGESGCGKTTAGKLLLGLMEPDEGAVYFRGRSLAQIMQETPLVYRRAAQMVFQNPLASFNPMLTVGATLLDAMRLRDDLGRAGRMAEAARLLQRVGLEADFAHRYPTEMSGGQLQRAGIARALASQPALIFLDEPTSALDMSVRGQIINLLLELQAEYRLAYILVSHDLTVVRALAHEVLVMYLGQVVEAGPVSQVLAHPLHPYTQGLLAATHLGRLAEQEQKRPLRVRGEVLQLPVGYQGCKLTRRCPFELERCRRQPQRLETVAPDHRARCWRALELEKQPESTVTPSFP